MKISSRLFPIMGIAMLSMPMFGSDPGLPKVEILGKEYYYHEIKRGESIYGVAKKYDWDINELVRLNPNAASNMESGDRLYYPTGRVTVVKEISGEDAAAPESAGYEPITHVVKRGETVYSISRQYNIPLETIYAAYPSAKYGIKAGDKLVIEQTPESVSNKYLYYVVKPGDTLYSLAKKYHTSVEDILRANPGVSDRTFRIGDTIRIAVNSNSRRIHTELVEEERLASIDSYKVQKNDTWSSISRKTGVDVATLKEVNDETAVPKKNDVLAVPVMETVQVEKEYEEEDPRELTTEGIQELYDSVHNTNSDAKLTEVRVAMLLDEPNSKKDIEFVRGFLIALDEMKDSPYKINMKAIDGRASTTVVVSELDDFEPNLVVATADKAFPAFLADYGNTNNVEIVNVFDVKTDLYEDNPSMVQMLPPSAFFNEQVADRLFDDYSAGTLLLVGIADENDGIAELLKSKFPEDKVKTLSISSLADYTVSDSEKYLLYGYPSKKEEVAEFMNVAVTLKEESPFSDITVVGRPNWVTLTENLGDKFAEGEVIIPSRLWYDSESEGWKRFSAEFNEMFGSTPVKSFPNFAASGYDIARYFIGATAENGGDYNKGFRGGSRELLQTDINLDRTNNWGGFLNSVAYLIQYRPGGYVDKIIVK